MTPYICPAAPIPVRAVMTWFSDECELLVECRGDVPRSGSFIVGLEVRSDSGEIRHCCIEYADASPAGIFTFDLWCNLQFAHDLGTVKMRGPLLEGRFPAWIFSMPGSEPSFSVFCIQNGVTTASGVQVEQTSAQNGRAPQWVTSTIRLPGQPAGRQ